MAVEFRSPGIGDIYRMIWRQKLTVALPVIAIAVSVGFVVIYKLPNVYESKALLTITPPQISTSVVRSMSDEDISQRLNAITEEVKSRSSLEPIVTKDNLFATERQNGAPMESIIETMKKNIKVEVLSTNDEKQATTFNIIYRDKNDKSAQTVVRELSSKYVNAQQQTSFIASESTREFFDKQLAESKAKLDGIDKQRLDYMLSNSKNLPASQSGLIAQLSDLRNQEKTWSSEKELRFSEIGRLRDNRSSIEKQKGIAQEYAEKEAEQNQRFSDPTRTPAYGQLVNKRSELQGQLENLLKQYRAQHPEVIAKQDQINATNKEIEELKSDAKRSNDEARQFTQGKAALQVKLLENEAAKIDGEIIRQEILMKSLEDRIAGLQPQSLDLQRRIDSVPNSEVALDSFNRTYNMEKTTFDELQKKKNDADIAAKSVLENKGESIRIVDNASLSQVPVAPNRPLLIGIGVGVGLLIGLVLAALFEMPRLLTIQNLDDAKHYTNLPVLASIPEMLTPREKFWRRGTNFMKAIAGVVIAAGSIPLLIIALQVTHIFDRFVR